MCKEKHLSFLVVETLQCLVYYSLHRCALLCSWLDYVDWFSFASGLLGCQVSCGISTVWDHSINHFIFPLDMLQIILHITWIGLCYLAHKIIPDFKNCFLHSKKMYSQILLVPFAMYILIHLLWFAMYILMHLLWFPYKDDLNVPGTTVFDQNVLFRSV